uniref:Uncharacterized protein n=1 Tax=Arundo donax TaxID=35708 RepID=A0A0A8ZD67_ARUDO
MRRCHHRILVPRILWIHKVLM